MPRPLEPLRPLRVSQSASWCAPDGGRHPLSVQSRFWVTCLRGCRDQVPGLLCLVPSHPLPPTISRLPPPAPRHHQTLPPFARLPFVFQRRCPGDPGPVQRDGVPPTRPRFLVEGAGAGEQSSQVIDERLSPALLWLRGAPGRLLHSGLCPLTRKGGSTSTAPSLSSLAVGGGRGQVQHPLCPRGPGRGDRTGLNSCIKWN